MVEKNHDLPPPDPALHLLACWIVASTGAMKPKARERVFRRMRSLVDPTAPKVVHIRPRALDRAVDGVRYKSAAYWRAIEPALKKLAELGG